MIRSHRQGHRILNYREFKSEINIVPLLDILLVLLLFLMATVINTQIFIQSVEFDLPYAKKPQTININSNLPVIIEVSGVEQYGVVIHKDRLTQLSFKQVVSEVQRCLSINPKTVFLIGGAKSVPYDTIIKVLNLLHNAGVKSVGLMTQPI